MDSHASTSQSHSQLDSLEDVKNMEANPEKQKVLRWVLELQNAERVFGDYHKRVDIILERYRDERDDAIKGDRRYNALWSMKETLKPLLFAEPPIPYVERQHDDDDRAGRDASLLLQRLLSSCSGSDNWFDALNEAVDDYVLAGRGVTWITYAPEFAVREASDDEEVDSEDDVPEDEFGEPDEKGRKPKYKSRRTESGKIAYRPKFEYKASEKCLLESVNTKDILHGPATRWRHVPWVARRVPMLKSEMVKRFGKEVAEKVPLAAKEAGNPRHKAPNTDDFKGQFARAVVWEIWDRVTRKIVWICPDYPDKVLDEKSDALNLENFFPCAKPMFGTMTNDTLIPVPDYTEWQDVALELDDVTHRISLLIQALRVVGVYSEQFGTELSQLLNGKRQNQMIPVSNWAMMGEKGGLKGAVDFFPIEQVIVVLDKLYEVRARLVQEMYEITGISDIVRGASDPRETAAAQKLKGNFANARLTSRQKMVARHARECLTILAEIACSMYSDETIMRLSGALQIFQTEKGEFDTARWKAALHLLRDEPMRMLRVKIDTESLAESALNADREEATQFLTAIGGYMQQSVAMLQVAPNMGHVLGKLMLFAVRKFRVGRALESEIDSAIRELAKTGLGQPQDAEGAGGEAGMNGLEAQVEHEKNAIAREKLALDKEKIALQGMKQQFDQQKAVWEAQSREKDLGIKGYKAKEDIRVKDKQIDVQAAGQQQQMQLQAQEQQQNAQLQQQQMQHEQTMGNAELQMQHAEHQASREDAAADRDMRQQEFAAGRQDKQTELKERAVDRQVQQRNAAEDRKVKMTQAKAKAAKPAAKPKSKPKA